MPRTMSQKSAKAKADILFSQLIRTVGHCENCGKTEWLQCAHWISRRYSNTRVDPDNAFCLCSGCHIYFTHNPTEFSEWAISRRGRVTYERLFEAAQKTARVDWLVQVEVLRRMLEDAA